MIIWLALLIPAIAIAGLLIFGKGKVLLWEAAIMLIVPLIVIGLFKWGVEAHQVSDTEWWGNYATSATYYDDWDERVSCRHPISCSHTCCTGSANNRSCSSCHSNDGYYHPYDVDYHPEHWTVEGTGGLSYSISKEKYYEFQGRWGGTNYFVEMNRDFHSIDGDAHRCNWDGKFETLEPFSTEHSYVNKVAASNSIFNYREVTKEEVKKKGLFEYPKVYEQWKQQAVLGINDPYGDQLFRNMNGLLGESKQVKVIVLVWKNKDESLAKDQQQYWKNGNKNEFVINVGTDDNGNIKWAYIFSWTKSEQLKIDVRNYLNERRGQWLNLPELAIWLKPQLEANWVRTRFREFNYLTVEPPLWAVITTYLLSFALTGGIGFWCYINEHCETESSDDEDNFDKNSLAYYYRNRKY